MGDSQDSRLRRKRTGGCMQWPCSPLSPLGLLCTLSTLVFLLLSFCPRLLILDIRGDDMYWAGGWLRPQSRSGLDRLPVSMNMFVVRMFYGHGKGYWMAPLPPSFVANGFLPCFIAHVFSHPHHRWPPCRKTAESLVLWMVSGQW